MKFSFFTGDLEFLNYGGKWLSQEQSSPEGERYFLGIELINWEDAQGKPGPGNTKYNLTLVLIPHPLEISPERLQEALQYWGEDSSREPSLLELVGMLWDYGVAVPIEQVNTNNWREGFRRLRKAARELNYEEAMDSKPVNKIGSTGREYMSGDFTSAIARGLQEGRKDCWLLSRIQGMSREELEALGFKNPLEER